MSTSQPLNPWAWRPSSSPWFQRLACLATRWKPSPELGFNVETLVHSLLVGGEREERWLLHPCVSPLTLPSDECRLQQDFQLAVWVAAHSSRSPGEVKVPEPLWAWSPDGGTPIQPGVYDLGALGAAVAGHDWPWRIAFDTWGRSVGSPPEQSWAALIPSTRDEKVQLQREVTVFLQASAAAERSVGTLHDWVTSVTKVVVPLRRIGVRYSQSYSCRQLPGVVFLTIHDEVQVLEALVHETAHHYLFLAEMRNPLVDPSHLSNYPSPLRAEPRPLIGVLLAYHALAYICAFYVDALRHSLASSLRCEQELKSARSKLREAQGTLVSNRRFLTDAGQEFLELTMQVAGFSDEVT
jgi:hypothetical protein